MAFWTSARFPYRAGIRFVLILVAVVATYLSTPGSGRIPATVLCVLGFAVVVLIRLRQPALGWWIAGNLLVAGLAGAMVLQQAVMGFTLCFVLAIRAVSTQPDRISVPIAALDIAVSVLALIVSSQLLHGPEFTGSEVGVGFGLAGSILGIGSVVRENRINKNRASVAEQLLVEQQRTAVAEARASALDERSRIAREIHDILAHTLSAQTVILEGARLLLARGGNEERALAQVEQAQQLARDGLSETRQAVSSLRENSGSLRQELARLCEPAGIRLTVTGTPREAEPPVTLALQRVTQEALTNITKHAPGSTAQVRLEFMPESIAVAVTNDPPPAPSAGATVADGPALHRSGGGFGLRGIRERVELLGGTTETGPWCSGAAGRLHRAAAEPGSSTCAGPGSRPRSAAAPGATAMGTPNDGSAGDGGGFRVWAQIPTPTSRTEGKS